MKRPIRFLFVLPMILPILLLTACAPDAVEDVFWHMDTAVTVRLYGDGTEIKTVLQNCDELLAQLDTGLSVNNAQSPIARFNASADGSDVSMPEDTLTLIARSLELSAATAGTFDITTAALSILWQDCEDDGSLPTARQLTDALALVGSEHLILSNDGLTKDVSDVRIDLGGIGKGYATDRLLDYLDREDGVSAALVSFGSNVAVIGAKPDGEPWKIAVRNPDGAGFLGYIYLSEGEVLSVSGDYERYFTIDGVSYSHILDPATGYPPENGLRSVAVLCSDGTTADALSTAFMIMGEERVRALYESDALEFEAVFIYDDHVEMTEKIQWSPMN